MHAHALRTDYLLLPTEGPKGGEPGSLPFGNIPAELEDLSYRIELWSADKARVEAVLAVTSSAAVGFAAYYAAAREYPDRYITLRHKGRTFSGWNSPKH
ncbi:MAG TPA: hypothetical protein VFO61_04015 [Alphaproteobacteria bacterium]|nr:hypothetical protein [Alphaproteobacteria bacterium]